MTFHDLTSDDFETVIVPAGAGDEIAVSLEGVADVIRFKITGEQSAGTITFLEYDAVPNSNGVRPHYHDGHEELFYVLEGVLRMRKDDDIIDAGPGDFVFVPRGVVHAFWNATDEPTRFIGTWTPAGFEHLFTERDQLAQEIGALTPERNAELAAKHGVRFVEMLPGERD